MGYISRVGGRSFIFQILLAGWTVIMWGVALLFVAAAILGSRGVAQQEWDKMSIQEKIQDQQRRADEQMNPQAAHDGKMMVIGGALLCPMGIWFAVALPLLIAAIATAGRRR